MSFMEGQFRPPLALEAVVADALARPLPRLTPRKVRLPGLPRKADVVTGMRRVGKTWLLFQLMQEAVAAGAPRESLLYLNFEDERLLPLSARDLQGILDAWGRRHPELLDRPRTLLLDEVQNVQGWERFVRRLLDEGGIRVVVTGSSARLLGREIATALRGRSLTTELFPFSFAEFVAHRGLELPSRWPPPAAVRVRLSGALREYLAIGGFPEVQELRPELRLRVLQEYVDMALLRDVVERHAIADVAPLRWLLRRFLRQPAGAFSVHRLHRDLVSQGYRVGKDTVHEHVARLEEAHLLHIVDLDARSERQRQVNPRKAYPADHSLATACSFQAGENIGHLLENVVCAQLLRQGARLGYVRTRGGREVDFLARWPDGRVGLIQVAAELAEPETRRRELLALEEAGRERRIPSRTIVTLEDEEEARTPAGTVRIVPAWRWLLEGEGKP